MPIEIGLRATSRTIGLLNLNRVMKDFMWCGQFTEKTQHSVKDQEGILGYTPKDIALN